MLMLLVAIAIIFYFNYSNSKTFEETFTTGLTNFNDPSMYLNSCKALVKDKLTVNKLASDNGCDKPVLQDLFLTNRYSINKKIACKNFTDKKIMLEKEQPSWCDRVRQAERDQIVQALVPAPGPVAVVTNPEGPEYMQTQYSTIFGSLLPNEPSNKSYVSFSNMFDPVSNTKYTSV
jgi:hypothetical protein